MTSLFQQNSISTIDITADTVTANYFIGNGANLTNITAAVADTALSVDGSNVQGEVASAANAVFATTAGTADSVAGANVVGIVGQSETANYVIQPIQSNITSVGILSNLEVSGNISTNSNLMILTDNSIATSLGTNLILDPNNDGTPLGNVIVLGDMQVTGNLTYNDIVNATTNDLQWVAANNAGSPALASGGGLAVGPAGSPYVTWTFDSTIPAWRSSTNIIASGNITGTDFIGSGAGLTNIPAANIVGTSANANYAAYAGNITIAAQANITSVGTLSALTVNGITTLGAVNNVTISGGTSGQALTTNGGGVLSWATPSSSRISNGTSNVSIPVASDAILGFVNAIPSLKINTNSVAVGYNASGFTPSPETVAVGFEAGYAFQNTGAVAVGYRAGSGQQLANAISIGRQAGASSQRVNAIAIGVLAGNSNQNINSIAIGAFAAPTNQGANSIVINATGANLNNTTPNSLKIAPIRNDVANIANVLYYNTTTNEITYAPPTGGGSSSSISNGTSNVSIPLAGKGIEFYVDGASFGSLGNSFGSGNGISLGYSAEAADGGLGGIALGAFAQATQDSISIGQQSGNALSSSSVLIGYRAGNAVSYDNTIILNATSTGLSAPTNNSFVVKPVRGPVSGALAAGFVAVFYNPTTGEFVYGTA
jgi:hypothetical protein